MSTNNSIFYALKITLDYSTPLTNEEAFIHDNEIFFVNGGYNSATATYEDTTSVDLTNMVNDRTAIKGIGKSTSTIDITLGGDFSTLNKLSWAIINKDESNTSSYHSLMADIEIIGSKVQYYVVIDDVFYPKWSGIISNYLFSQDKFTFECDDQFIPSAILLPSDEGQLEYLGNVKNAPIGLVNNGVDGYYTVERGPYQLLSDMIVSRVFPNSNSETNSQNEPFTPLEPEIFERTNRNVGLWFSDDHEPINEEIDGVMITSNNDTTVVVVDNFDGPGYNPSSLIGKYLKFKSSDELHIILDVQTESQIYFYIEGYPKGLSTELGAGYGISGGWFDSGVLTDTQATDTISIVDWNSTLDIGVDNIIPPTINSSIILPYDIIGIVDGKPVGFNYTIVDGKVKVSNTFSMATILANSLNWAGGVVGDSMIENAYFDNDGGALDTQLRKGVATWIGTLPRVTATDPSTLIPGSNDWINYCKNINDGNLQINLRTRYDQDALVYDTYTPSIYLNALDDVNSDGATDPYNTYYNRSIDNITFDVYRTLRRTQGLTSYGTKGRQVVQEIFSSGDVNVKQPFIVTEPGDTFVYSVLSGMSTIYDPYRVIFNGDYQDRYTNATYIQQMMYPFQPAFKPGDTAVRWSPNGATIYGLVTDFNIEGQGIDFGSISMDREDIIDSLNSGNDGGLIYSLINNDSNTPEWQVMKLNHIGLMSETRLDDVLDDLKLNVVNNAVTDIAEEMSVYEAFQYLVNNGTKDTTAEYSNLPTTRDDWLVGKLLSDQKKTHEYFKELCKVSMVAGYTTRTGDVEFKAFREDTSTPVLLDEDAIVGGSIKDFGGTPLSRCYNEFVVNYNKNHDSGEFEKSYSVNFVDEDSFPLITENWQEYVVGFPEYNSAKILWEIAHESYLRTKTINKTPSTYTDVDWYFDRNDFYGTDVYDYTDESAYKYFINLVEWQTVQKFKTGFKLPINSDTITYSLMDRVTFQDDVITGVEGDGNGWFSKVSVDPNTSYIDVEVTFETFNFQNPITSDCIVITETGNASDPDIIETGVDTDPDITEPCA